MATNPWDLTRAQPDAYRDWQYEVGNGDTLLGFEAWWAAYAPVYSKEET